jgi:hypothetical protein
MTKEEKETKFPDVETKTPEPEAKETKTASSTEKKVDYSALNKEVVKLRAFKENVEASKRAQAKSIKEEVNVRFFTRSLRIR